MTDIRTGLALGAAVSFLACCVFLLLGYWLLATGMGRDKKRVGRTYGRILPATPEKPIYNDPGTGKPLEAYRPTVRFLLPDGTLVERKYFVGTHPEKYAPGQRVLVKYNPKDHDDFMLQTDCDVEWLPIAVLTAAGFAALAITIAFAYSLFCGTP